MSPVRRLREAGLKSHPGQLYQSETSEGALGGQSSGFMRCKAIFPAHREEGLECLQAHNQPVGHTQVRGKAPAGSQHQSQGRQESGWVIYTEANLGQPRTRLAKARMASGDPSPQSLVRRESTLGSKGSCESTCQDHLLQCPEITGGESFTAQVPQSQGLEIACSSFLRAWR